MTKLLYCIRHGIAEHNLNYYKYGVQTFYDPTYTDTSLVNEGYEQAIQLRNTWSELNSIELVIVSPLKRTLQTAVEIFKHHNAPIISLECCREYPMGKQTCNKRSPKKILETKYPFINFDDLQMNEDNLWLPHREESIDELEQRISQLKDFISGRPETKIALVNHNSFIGQLKDKEIKYMENGKQELLHCYPYKIELS